jgi:8-oxo-dGTP diphosphatase
MRENFPYVGSTYLFLIEDNRILLQRRQGTNFYPGFYGVPAGHLDGNETAREGCAREIKEEIGIKIEPNDLRVVHVVHRKGERDERIDFFMMTDKYSGEIANMEPDKCDDLRWFDLDKLPDNMVDHVEDALKQYRKGLFYSEFGW